MPLTASERVKRQIEKLKANGEYDAFKAKRNLAAKTFRDKLKKVMGNLSARSFSTEMADIRQKTRDRVRKHRQKKKDADDANSSRVRKPKKILTATQVSKDVQQSSDASGEEETLNEPTFVEPRTVVMDEIPAHLAQESEPTQNYNRRSQRLNKSQKSTDKNTGVSVDVTISSLEHDNPESNGTSICVNTEICDTNDSSMNIVPEDTSDSEVNAAPSSPPKRIPPPRKQVRKILVRGSKAHLRNYLKNNSPVQRTYSANSSFPTNSAYRKAFSRACQALPKCPVKRREIVEKMHEKFVGPSKKKIVRPRSTRLNADITKSVIDFYERDDISQQAPGLKDCIKVKDGSGNSTTLQIKYLMYPIRTVYEKYCAELGQSPLKLSKFFSLRPRHVVSLTKIPHTVCLCPYHENFVFAFNALRKIAPELPEYGDADDSFYKTFFCEKMSKNCWHNECDECKNMFRDVVCGIAHACDAELTVKWMLWKEFDWMKDGKVMGKRWQRVTETGTVTELMTYLSTIAERFVPHVFVKRQQSKRYQEDIKSMDPSIAIMQLDFAENPVCVYQNQIQRAHFNQNQLALLTAAMWHCQQNQSQAIVSDNLDHTKTAVVPYVDRLLEDLPKAVKTLKIWSGGPSKQFKNKFIAASLDPLEKKYNLKIEWNFFATSHGKGPVDGIGGAHKRQVRQKVMSGEVEVRNASEFVNAVDRNSKINVIEMNEEEANERLTSLNLLEIWKKAPDLKGISNFHHLMVINGKAHGRLISEIFS